MLICAVIRCMTYLALYLYYRLLYGLGIRNIGQQTARDISRQFGEDFAAFWGYLKEQAGECALRWECSVC